MVDEEGMFWGQFLAIHIGKDAPRTLDQIWFDTDEEQTNVLDFPDDYNLIKFQDIVEDVRETVKDIQLEAMRRDVHPGTFYDVNSNSGEVDEGSNSVSVVRVKTGNNDKLRQLNEGELAFCADTGSMYIGVRKSATNLGLTNVKVGGGAGGDMENISGEHIDIEGQDGIKYRFFVDHDGKTKRRETERYTAPNVPSNTAGNNYKGLIVNRYYGGGPEGTVAPLSHSFIELYNNDANGRTINLNGLAVYYKTLDDGTWRRQPLKGYVPPKTSYLIRGGRCNNIRNATCRYDIETYDLNWEQVMSPNSAMVYLGVDIGDITMSNPFYLSNGMSHTAYIDILASASETETRTLSALEFKSPSAQYYKKLIDMDHGVQRLDFLDSNSTYADLVTIDYRTCNLDYYAPRHVDSGPWDLYYDKLRLNPNIPNLLNMQYGRVWSTRVFTWQSAVTKQGWVRYRQVGTRHWYLKETNREVVYHADGDATIHRVIIKNLQEGVYEYQAGEPGSWSDLAEFEVKSYLNADGTFKKDNIRLIHTSDQQSLYEHEYDVWKWATKKMEEEEPLDTWDFAINTGDISQSGIRSFEWRNYWLYPQFLKEKCHMLTCGNNDLLDKKYSFCFKYYESNENDFNGDNYQCNYMTHPFVQGETPYGNNYASCHSVDLGYVHFVYANTCSTTAMEDPDLWVKQMKWIKRDMEEAKARLNPPRWFVLVTHYGALTVTRMKTQQSMIPFVEDLGFHVVMCGHHHTYSRTEPIKMDLRTHVEDVIGHDMYTINPGCNNKICNAVYSKGYLETFANAEGIHIVPAGATYDQTTEGGTDSEGNVADPTNGNIGSRNTYINHEKGTVWVMAQASGAKLQSNKDMEKFPTPWFYGWVVRDDKGNISNNDHPYDPNYLVWDFGWDKINVKSYLVKNIMYYEPKLSTAVQIPTDEFSYDDVYTEKIDDFDITWKDLK